MKKSLLICLSMLTIPTMCFGEHPRVTELIKIKQQKMAELDKCAGTTKSLKIAGISTLGITAVGIAGNIAEAKVLSDYDKKINTADKDIAKAQKELDDKRTEMFQRQAEEREAALAAERAAQEAMMLKNVVEADIADINSKGGTLGDKAIYRGYFPERLPDGLRNRFATALLGFIDRCWGLKNETTGIAEVSIDPRKKSTAESYKIASNNLYKEDEILPNLTEMTFAECTVTKCLTDKGFQEQTVDGVKTCVKPGGQAGNDQGNKPAKGTDCKSQIPGAKTATIDANGKCIVSACDTVNGWNLQTVNGAKTCVKSNGQAGNDQGNKPAKGTDCKSQISGAKTATIDANGECKVTECDNPNKEVKDNTCVDKPEDKTKGCGEGYSHRPNKEGKEQCYTDDGRAEVYSINDFEKVQVTEDQGKSIIARWAQKKGVTLHCNKERYASFGQDYLSCETPEPIKIYSFKFDDLTESSKNTIRQGFAIAGCVLMGGEKVTESDTGLSNAVRCEIDKCESLDAEYAALGYSDIKAKWHDVYSTAAGNGTHKIWQRRYCRVEY